MKTFTWNAGVTNPLTVRASTTTSGFETQIIQQLQELL